jgi:hypothetical protein
LRETVIALSEETKGMRPRGLEARFGFDGSPAFAVDTEIGKVRFHGVVDRVDVRDDGTARVIDYKTGSHDLDARSLGEGRRLQLVIYALATETALKLGKVVDGFYWAILKAEASSLRLAKFQFETNDRRGFSGLAAAIDLGREHIGRDVRGIRAGRFEPVPPRDGCPKYCAARTICWRYRPMAER